MKRTYGLVLLLVAALLPVGALFAYEVPKDIVIKRPEKNPPLSPWVGEVEFPHGKHAMLNACRECHHKESDKSIGEFVSCTQCHNDPDPDKETGFYLAWHNDSTNSCLGCHRQKRLTKQYMPPISCTRGCHKKD